MLQIIIYKIYKHILFNIFNFNYFKVIIIENINFVLWLFTYKYPTKESKMGYPVDSSLLQNCG